MKIESIVIKYKDFDKTAPFWQRMLHYVPREPAEPGWVALQEPEGRGPNVSINQTSEKWSLKNRLQLDLYTGTQGEEVEQLHSIGATIHRPRESDEDFVALEDPEGNLFCIVDKSRS